MGYSFREKSSRLLLIFLDLKLIKKWQSDCVRLPNQLTNYNYCYMAESARGQDEANTVFCLDYPNEQEGPILPTRDFPRWSRKKLEVEREQRVTMVSKVKSNCLPCLQFNRWLNFRVRGQFEIKILRADVNKYRPEVYKSEKPKILKKIHKVALRKLLT